jgi:hypothetical protein
MFAVSYLKTETKIGAEIAKVSDEMLKIIEAEGPVR